MVVVHCLPGRWWAILMRDGNLISSNRQHHHHQCEQSASAPEITIGMDYMIIWRRIVINGSWGYCVARSWDFIAIIRTAVVVFIRASNIMLLILMEPHRHQHLINIEIPLALYISSDSTDQHRYWHHIQYWVSVYGLGEIAGCCCCWFLYGDWLGWELFESRVWCIIVYRHSNLLNIKFSNMFVYFFPFPYSFIRGYFYLLNINAKRVTKSFTNWMWLRGNRVRKVKNKNLRWWIWILRQSKSVFHRFVSFGIVVVLWKVFFLTFCFPLNYFSPLRNHNRHHKHPTCIEVKRWIEVEYKGRMEIIKSVMKNFDFLLQLGNPECRI